MDAQFKKYLQKLSIKELTEMQQDMLKQVPLQSELILYSPTGSGKTLGFLLPMLKLLDKKSDNVQALILVPARELAIQVEQVFKSLNTGLKVNCCYGGHSMKVEENNLTHPPAVLIGTPGRIADHIRRENIELGNAQTLILDEFDKSLELGFQNEMSYIIQQFKNVKRKILTSATQLEKVPDFVALTNPYIINFLQKHSDNRLELYSIRAEDKDKLTALFNLLCAVGNDPTLIFCNHREAVERISELLDSKEIYHDIFHGGMKQEDRERALIKFRNGTHHTLITTDLAARGLDIPVIKNIIHYQLPTSIESYTHRNGRTARMDAHGKSFLVLSESEYCPKFINDDIQDFPLETITELPAKPQWETLYIGAGKKNKVNKIDIAGFLYKKGGAEQADIGIIEVLDFSSFVAVKQKLIKGLIRKLKNEKIKGKKIKISIAR